MSTQTNTCPMLGTACGFSIMSAGMAFTRPAPVMYPAADAHEAMALFSRMLKPGNHFGNMRCSPAKIAYARIDEVIATPMLQPALSPMYTFESDITPPSSIPITSARIVSWGMRSPA